MDTVRTLFNNISTPEQRIEAANIIITTYNVPFSTTDMIDAFSCLRIKYPRYRCPAILMHLSLTTNLRMFIAIVYAILDNKISGYWMPHLICRRKHSERITLGCKGVNHVNLNYMLKIWVALYDYYEFDISVLALPDELRALIQKHIDSKVNYTKRAIK